MQSIRYFIVFYIVSLYPWRSFTARRVVSAQVVMAVAQLYFHLAPKAEVGVIAKALVRLLRSHR